MTGRPAVFFDRDGTLIEDPGFLRDPAHVRLFPGVAAALARVNTAGLAAVIVTNQSGIARGLLTDADYRAVHRRLQDLLAAEGAHVDADYYCPHLPDITGPCDCRKPGLLLYRQAAAALGLDLAASWWVGDRVRDLEPATALGGRAILVQTGMGAVEAPGAAAAGFPVEPDLPATVGRILGRLPPSPERDYFPAP